MMMQSSPRKRAGLRLVGATVVLITAASALAHAEKQAEQPKKLGTTFNSIYQNGVWAKGADGKGTSGTGSTVAITNDYRRFLQDFIKSNNIKSVVDAGCGDWEFSSVVDWNNARYLGVDISTTVIADVRKKFQSKTVKFMVGDVTDSLPPADLLICKDVLQHLPIKLIKKFIKNNLKRGKYKWALITNDRGTDNPDIKPGEYRLINLSAPPLNVKGLVAQPVKFEGQPEKTVELLDLR